MFERILVPLDGSPQAEDILPRVEELAAKHKSKVFLLRVVDGITSPVDPDSTGAQVLISEREQQEDEAEQYLMVRRNYLRNLKIDSEALIMRGGVVESITSAASTERIDAIAMVSRGRSRFGNMMYGNVTNELLNRIDIPLLVIRPMR
jgi:nucleotide-binding universal stress UspA family protein